MKLGTHSDRLRILRLTLEAEEEQETDPFDIPEEDDIRVPVEQPIAKKVSGTILRLLLKNVPVLIETVQAAAVHCQGYTTIFHTKRVTEWPAGMKCSPAANG